MTIYEELVQRVSDGETFHIDFEKRTMKVGKQKLIDGGEYDITRTLIVNNDYDLDVILEMIELLYRNYKYSLPSERSDSKRRKYFKALHVDDILDEQLMLAERREVTCARLEGFILCMVLTGQLIWDEPTMGKWFYQSANDPDLVILRSWVENKNN